MDAAHSLQVEPEPVTAEQFWRLSQDNRWLELAGGKVVPVTPVAPTHGEVDCRLILRLGLYIQQQRLGKLYTHTGFILARRPDVVRGPDQAFVSNLRAQAHPPPERGFWEVAPDLVVEIVSPDDSAETMAEKLSDYLQAGVRLIWFVYPKQQRVHVYRPQGAVTVLSGDALLEGGDVVPGFSVPVRELWA